MISVYGLPRMHPAKNRSAEFPYDTFTFNRRSVDARKMGAFYSGRDMCAVWCGVGPEWTSDHGKKFK